MSLRRARESFPATQAFLNPIWRFVSRDLTRTLNAQLGDPEFTRELYVTERDGAGITEADLVHYLDNPRGRPFCIQAGAGTGKTTFLRHTLQSQEIEGRIALVWLDMLNEVSVSSSTEPDFSSKVARVVAGRLAARMAGDAVARLTWYRYYLEHAPDPSGRNALLREELERSPEAAETRSKLEQVLEGAERDLGTLLTLRLSFVENVEHRWPVLVLDNLDQLSGVLVQQLMTFAQAVCGSRRGASIGNRVILSLRPVTVTTAILHTAVSFAEGGVLAPPLFQRLVAARVDAIVRERQSKGRVISSEIVVGQSGRRMSLRELSDRPNADLSDVAVDVVRAAVEALIRVDTPYGTLVRLVHRMTNHNNRLSLLAISHFVASGHTDLDQLEDLLLRGERAHVSWRKLFRALLVGTQQVYQTRGSWVFNLFDDGTLHSNAALCRWQLLRMFAPASNQGIAIAQVHEDAVMLLGHDAGGVQRALGEMIQTGLLHEVSVDIYALSGAGRFYAYDLAADFEYLQHMAVEAPMAQEFVVPCERMDEGVVRRFRRVRRMADWVRHLEIAQMARAFDRSRLEDFVRYFDDRTLAGDLAHALMRFLDGPARNLRDELTEERERTAAFAASCTFKEMLREADPQRAPTASRD